ncbi:MAG: ATP-binding cassette domain-containing protein [Candidatus Latescibacteria bacterium]|nr:ATP-binding cassette domain-containing protein [Candidatus Latescibacterota bacterium]
MERIGQALQQILAYYPRCLALIWAASHRYALLALAFSIASALVPAAQVWLSKIAIDTVVQAGATTAPTPQWTGLLLPIGAVLAVWMAGGICQAVSGTLTEQIGFLVRGQAHHLILRKAARLDIAFFETPSFFDEMEKARSEGYRAHNLAVLSIQIISAAVSLTAMLVLLYGVHWAAVLILLLTVVPQVVVGGYYAGKRFSVQGTHARNQRMAFYLSQLLGSRDAAKEIRLFGLHHELLRRFADFWARYTKDVMDVRLAQERSTYLFGLLSMAGTAAIWGYAVVRAVNGHITVGDVALAFQAAEQARSGLSRLFGDLGVFYEHTIFAGNLFRFLDLEADSVPGSLARPPAHPAAVPARLQQGIEFRRVSFRYPRSQDIVLKDLSFSIEAGQSLAIVGENGAGKTTLVKLLCRFYDPSEGAIYLDGRDLRQYDIEDLHRRLGVLFQDFVRYDLSARENIGFGQIDALDDPERIARAATRGGAGETIAQLPRQFDTVLGRTLDEGVDLSGGQWQKIALSRAFMRDAPILILDEPTAALDALAEAEIFDRFAELTADRTTLFISHRFSTVRMARQIVVLERGSLVQQGTHDELMALDGLYHTMFTAQAERYT